MEIQAIAEDNLHNNFTVVYDPQVVTNIADSLRNITTDMILVPNDVSTTVETLNIIVK